MHKELFSAFPLMAGTPGARAVVPDDHAAVDEVGNRVSALRRAGNYVDSAFGVVKHIADDNGLSRTAVDRLNLIIDDEVDHHEQRLANIFAFRRTIEQARNQPEKYVGTARPIEDIPVLGSSLQGSRQALRTMRAEDAVLQYWRHIRHDLSSWLGIGIDSLSASLGLSYATVANLGKRRPQGRTIRPLLRVYGLAKSVLDLVGEDAGRAWLGTEGQDLLRQGIDRFEDAVNDRLFDNTNVPRTSIQLREEPDIVWPEPVVRQQDVDVF